MNTPKPSEQLELPLEGTMQSVQSESVIDSEPHHEDAEPSNIVHFAEALKDFQENQKVEALRRILLRSDEVKEG